MTTLTTETARLATDFNSVRDGHSLIARFDFSGTPRLPAPGEQVELYDAEGNRCLGVIVEALDDDEFFRVNPIWDNWTDADEIHQTPAFEPVDLMAALRESVRHVADTKTPPEVDFTKVA